MFCAVVFCQLTLCYVLCKAAPSAIPFVFTAAGIPSAPGTVTNLIASYKSRMFPFFYKKNWATLPFKQYMMILSSNWHYCINSHVITGNNKMLFNPRQLYKTALPVQNYMEKIAETIWYYWYGKAILLHLFYFRNNDSIRFNWYPPIP